MKQKPAPETIPDHADPTVKSLTGEQLATALHELGVDFVLGAAESSRLPAVSPAELIAALANSDEARLRLALIPLFLRQPEYASQVAAAQALLPPTAQVTLRCYYSAAACLSRLHRARLAALFGPQSELPEFFAAELGLKAEGNLQRQLTLIAECQQALSGRRLNWRGTYEHAAERFLTHLEREVAWQP